MSTGSGRAADASSAPSACRLKTRSTRAHHRSRSRTVSRRVPLEASAGTLAPWTGAGGDDGDEEGGNEGRGPPLAMSVKMRTRREARDRSRGHRCSTRSARSSAVCAGSSTATQYLASRASRGFSNSGLECGIDDGFSVDLLKDNRGIIRGINEYNPSIDEIKKSMTLTHEE
jgi:hypothetical protein